MSAARLTRQQRDAQDLPTQQLCRRAPIAVRADKTLTGRDAQSLVHPTQATTAMAEAGKRAPQVEVQHATIGQQAPEIAVQAAQPTAYLR